MAKVFDFRPIPLKRGRGKREPTRDPLRRVDGWASRRERPFCCRVDGQRLVARYPFFVARGLPVLYHRLVVVENDAARIARNISAVRVRIKEAALRAGRNPNDVTLVAVSKTFPVEAIEAAVKAGITDIGESRIQEGIDKIERLGKIARWHLIGHLQSNKVKKAVACFDMIQSLDSYSLAEKAAEQAVKENKTIECLIEVNSSGESGKFGFSPATVLNGAEEIAGLPGIDLRGLMTVGPLTTDERRIRAAFELTQKVYEQIRQAIGPGINVLSMGMSSDYELAVECGSTMVRVGTAIFGAR
jgi:PLP dependent protein